MKQMIIITPEYHAILTNLQDTKNPIGFGKIAGVEKNGDEITLNFSNYFLHQTGAASPIYKRVDADEIISVRDRKIWKNSDDIFRHSPNSRPAGYVNLNDHEYGIKYYRCDGNDAYVRQKMDQIVQDNDYKLEPQAVDDEQSDLKKLCDDYAAKLKEVLAMQKSGSTEAKAEEFVSPIDPRIKTFVIFSTQLAYQNTDELAHALDTKNWQKACINQAKAN